MAMIMKQCSSCEQYKWHNYAAKDKNYRCTYCGHPVTSSPAKRDQQETLRRKQVQKVAR